MHKSLPLLANVLYMERTRVNLREILAANVERLMATHKLYGTQEKLAVKVKVNQTTISRLLNQSITTSIDVVSGIAEAFNLQPWQLLIDGLDPSNPPVLPELTKKEKELYEKLKELSKLLNIKE